jgi:hypothetical protein
MTAVGANTPDELSARFVIYSINDIITAAGTMDACAVVVAEPLLLLLLLTTKALWCHSYC